AVFVAARSGNWWSGDPEVTNVQYVDISDLEGGIKIRGDISVEGSLNWGDAGELQMNHFEGTLRVASTVRRRVEIPESERNPERPWETTRTETNVRISTIDTKNPRNLAVLDTLDVA